MVSKRVYVTGDNGRSTLLYMEGENGEAPHLREAWVTPAKSWPVEASGAAGTVAHLLDKALYRVDPWPETSDNAESVYLLVPDQTHLDGKQRDALNACMKAKMKAPPGLERRWRVGRAFPCGEGVAKGSVTAWPPPIVSDPSAPVVLVEYDQRWRRMLDPTVKDPDSEALRAPKILADRPFVIRTHDPTLPFWGPIRAAMTAAAHPRAWVAPYQDLANGSLRHPGTWEDIVPTVMAHLASDKTLYSTTDGWHGHVIIQFYEDGILWLPAGKSGGKLYKFAGEQCGSFGWKRMGSVLGGGNLVVAAVANALFADRDLGEALEEVLPKLRALVDAGYVKHENLVKSAPPPAPIPGLTELKWDRGRVITDDVDNAGVLAPTVGVDLTSWDAAVTLITGSAATFNDLLALRIGEMDVPEPRYARKLLALASSLSDYRKGWERDPAKAKVLSFALFGGPGSGKSFIARQILGTVDPRGEVFVERTYNLSQFDSPKLLLDALEEVRGIGQTGKLPLVLWDEFDTRFEGQRGGWLSRFLMPMQDAKFFAQGAERPLGPAVFVFIGGTFRDEFAFKDWALDDANNPLKGRDFHSRLAAAVSAPLITGPLPNAAGNLSDPWPRAARAALLRRWLRDREGLKAVDADVLAILLHAPLAHGVRSLELIVNNSTISKTDRFQLHHLPSAEVLQLHLDNDPKWTAQRVRAGKILELELDFVDGKPPFVLDRS